MTRPLALIYSQKPLPGNRLANRLQDLNYRVQAIALAEEIAFVARTTGAMLILAHIEDAKAELVQTIRQLRESDATRHIPVVLFGSSPESLGPAQEVGATLTVETSALLTHLELFLEQVLRVD